MRENIFIKYLITCIITFVLALNLFGEEYSLQTCLDIAYQQNLDLRLKELDIEKFEKKVSQAYSSVFPSISIESGAGYVIEPEEISFTVPDPSTGYDMTMYMENFDYAYQHTLTIQQVVFSAQALMGIKIARTQRDVEQFNYDLLKRNITAEVEKAFYNILITEKVIAILDKSYQQAQAHLEVAHKKFEQDLFSEFEVLRQEVNTKDVYSDLQSAKLNHKLSKQLMFLLLDMDFDTTITFKGDFEVPQEIAGLEESTELALNNRLEVSILDRSLAVLKYVIRAYQAEYLPNIVVMGTFDNYYASNDLSDYLAIDDFSREWFVGLGLQWEIFNGLNRENRISEAKINHKQLMLQNEQLLSGIKAEINQVYWQLESYETDYNTALSSLKEGEKLLEIANVQYEEGLITFVELNDAQLAYEATQLRYYSSLYNYNVALVNYYRAMGN
ncbi:TolC family protein [bacterium]|nr:TolC family protein [bacterium]